MRSRYVARRVLTAVASGEKPYGVLVDFMAFNAKAKGSPIGLYFPEGRCASRDRTRGDARDHAESAAARAFIDFILSDEGQKLALAMGYIPAKASAGSPHGSRRERRST
jgi:iron(III) transport system substrate-binding protein